MAKNKLHRFSSSDSISKIDEENGIIYGVSVITANREAKGHDMYIDTTTIEQVVKMGNEWGEQGLKARFDHPNACGGSMGTQIGRFKNFRIENNKAVADLYLYDTASNTPNGDYRSYIINMAKEDSNAFATSIVFKQAEPFILEKEEAEKLDKSDVRRLPHARLESLMACDVVDEAAANDGLFGRPDYLAEQAERWMNEKKDLVFSVLEKFFKKNNMNIEQLAKENESEALKQMETDLKALQEANESLTAKIKESEILLLDEKKKLEEANKLAVQELQDKLNKSLERIKELEELAIGTPAIQVVPESVIRSNEIEKPKVLSKADERKLMNQWIEEEKKLQTKIKN